QTGDQVAQAWLNVVLGIVHAGPSRAVADGPRRGAGPGVPLDDAVGLRGNRPALLGHPSADGLGRSLADPPAVDVQAGHAGLGGERDEDMPVAELALTDAEAFLGLHDDGAPLRRLVGQRRQLRGAGQFLLTVPAGRL